MLIKVIAKPGRKNAKSVWKEGQLVVSVKAPAKEGKANQELVRTLATLFGVSRSQVQIRTGLTGRQKIVRVDLGERAALKVLESIKEPTQERLL